MENSFKVGAVGHALGIINQDRGAGVSGQIGMFPSIVPLRVVVTDRALGTSRDAAAQIVQDEQLFPVLAAASVLSVIEKTSDRVGAGTAKITFEITARNMPGETFKRENMFYSPINVGEQAISELYELMALLASNRFQPVDIFDVQVDVTVDPERRTATIMEARSNVATAKPGDKIEITVTLKPFRGETITCKVPFTIPKDQPAGPLTLEVRAGEWFRWPNCSANARRATTIAASRRNSRRKLRRDVEGTVRRDRNNDIVVEVLSAEAGELLSGPGPAKAPRAKIDPVVTRKRSRKAAHSGRKVRRRGQKTESKSTYSTEYIIDSDAQSSSPSARSRRGDGSFPSAGSFREPRKGSPRRGVSRGFSLSGARRGLLCADGAGAGGSKHRAALAVAGKRPVLNIHLVSPYKHNYNYVAPPAGIIYLESA
jgi:hypothetical protein